MSIFKNGYSGPLMYADERAKIYMGNCIQLMPLMNPVDAVITDPPYGVTSYDWDVTLDKLYEFTERWLSFAAYLAPLIVTFYAFGHLPLLFKAAQAIGLTHRRTMTWARPPGIQVAASQDGFWYSSEAIVIFGEPKYAEHRKAHWFDVLNHPMTPNPPHPAMKPLALIEILVKAFTDPDATILDPFMGSGTTLRAAKNLGRNAIGIETNQAFVELAIARLRQDTLFEDEGRLRGTKLWGGGWQRGAAQNRAKRTNLSLPWEKEGTDENA